jgi:hypothetical protein
MVRGGHKYAFNSPKVRFQSTLPIFFCFLILAVRSIHAPPALSARVQLGKLARGHGGEGGPAVGGSSTSGHRSKERRVGQGAAAGENSRGGAAAAKGGTVGGAGGGVAEGLERLTLAREMRQRRGG